MWPCRLHPSPFILRKKRIFRSSRFTWIGFIRRKSPRHYRRDYKQESSVERPLKLWAKTCKRLWIAWHLADINSRLDLRLTTARADPPSSRIRGTMADRERALPPIGLLYVNAPAAERSPAKTETTRVNFAVVARKKWESALKPF